MPDIIFKDVLKIAKCQ